ncbi:eukaryotic translation initiation factor 4B-like [Uloborus diversus]|uniref:eukaryotic translation initiation factor 4B-like n=1 Tax=Uloborus diversus TaxID=327109 RepID=UPI0024097A04|nr:eukaryotic translation initiation factor 4B-like [Uloborus diversus]
MHSVNHRSSGANSPPRDLTSLSVPDSRGGGFSDRDSFGGGFSRERNGDRYERNDPLREEDQRQGIRLLLRQSCVFLFPQVVPVVAAAAGASSGGTGTSGETDSGGGTSPPRDSRYRDSAERDYSDRRPPDRTSYDSGSGGGGQRRKLQLAPRTKPIEPLPPPAEAVGSSSIFGGAKPVDTAAREREIEERLAREKEVAPPPATSWSVRGSSTTPSPGPGKGAAATAAAQEARETTPRGAPEVYTSANKFSHLMNDAEDLDRGGDSE